jgi:pyruvate-formate lyase-activating enzyme
MSEQQKIEASKVGEYLAEAEAAKQKRKEAKKASEAKIQPTKKEEAFSTFKLFIRENPKLYSLTVIVPHLSPQLPTFARPNLLPVKKTLGTQLIPRISLLTVEREESCRVQILEPLPIRIPPLLPPKLTLERPIDISVRPLIHSQPIKSLNIIQPKLKPLRPHIPTLTPLLTPLVKPISSCMPRLSAISSSSQREEKVSSTVERKEGEKQEAVVETKITAGVGERSPEISGDEIFIPPILEELSTATSLMDRPVCIILSKKADDSFVYSVAVICREIYRIVKGGKPTPRWISEGLKDEIERRLRAEDTIFIVDDAKSKLLPDFSKICSCKELLEKLNLEIVEDRLREFFSQGFGFVIFHVNERWASTFANLLRKKLGKRVDIIEIAPLNWELNTKMEVAKACWGFVEGEGGTFDDIFASCEKKFSEKLKEALTDVELTHWLVMDENAGDEHEAMKGVVAECLARELGATRKIDVIQMLKTKVIETEHPLDGERCDVYVAKLSKFVEIETFYGRGDPVMRLDNDTLSKYKGKRSVDIVLLTGITALLYARRLIKLANLYRREYGLEVNFYLPNIRERKLVPLKQVFHMLKSVIGTRRVEELTEDNVRRLWEEFSQALREGGKDPEKYREVFYLLLNRFETYQENLRRLLEEVKFG